MLTIRKVAGGYLIEAEGSPVSVATTTAQVAKRVRELLDAPEVERADVDEAGAS